MGEKGLSAKEEAFMLQELKMKSLKGHAASIIIALALAAGLLWGTGFGAFKAIGGPKPLDSLDVSELKGQYVEAEVYLIYDWYAYTERTKPLYCHREGIHYSGRGCGIYGPCGGRRIYQRSG